MGISNFYFTKISLAIPRSSTLPTATQGLSTRDMRLSEHAQGAATATMPRFPRYCRGSPHETSAGRRWGVEDPIRGTYI